VLDDVVQVSFGLLNYATGKFPLAELTTLPFVADKSEAASVALWRLYKSGVLDQEFDQVVPLALTVLSQSQLHLQKPLKSLDTSALSGLKVIGPSKHYSGAITRLGGTPLSFPVNEYYETLQRGTADGVITGWVAFASFKLGDVTAYHVDTTLGTAAAMVFMSKKRFEALSPAARKVLEENSGEALSRGWGQFWDQQDGEVRERIRKQAGHTVVELTPEQTEAWRRAVQPANDEILKSLPNGAKVLDMFRANLAAAGQ
jgi:TRAP-type C4-dicarboxylate transport system substrate-binding protein